MSAAFRYRYYKKFNMYEIESRDFHSWSNYLLKVSLEIVRVSFKFSIITEKAREIIWKIRSKHNVPRDLFIKNAAMLVTRNKQVKAIFISLRWKCRLETQFHSWAIRTSFRPSTSRNYSSKVRFVSFENRLANQ